MDFVCQKIFLENPMAYYSFYDIGNGVRNKFASNRRTHDNIKK